MEDIGAALGLLTRLPLPAGLADGRARGAAAAWAWPLAGLVVGLIAALAGALALALGLPAGLAAAAALGVQVMVTGAMHEDGLADCADGFWGGWSRERRLEIMRDSRIGSFGVLALVLTVIARWSALAALFAAGSVAAPLLAAAALSRAAMAAIMALLPGARSDGLSASVGRPAARIVWWALGVAALAAVLFTGLSGLLAGGTAAALGAVGVAALARARIGGQTGDVLGAGQQMSELAALAAFAALFT
ncbi:cobalamin-5'-phosphate synthase [Meinhardsimonia xiamenensis]|jgi:adenosylcobinamide-GDP ribazoletransferase|uniref:Adenosylcobinamide-GDP ribazoletransferase n=2 Tax=Meinhardsimonia xiamenensis TaxID=990712 RepID=A0A1G9B6Q4_9RHOB|nr:cobalamin-5'-phosphate synthase [Meinhardsimonia xiamenensis]SDK35232.1 cobalamin-5'-phosphate synthase [Meinhardsimonia xiamenensis]